MDELADELDALQRQKNQGRGVDCVRTLMVYLRAGDIEGAKAVRRNEGDKISSYPDIVALLDAKLK